MANPPGLAPLSVAGPGQPIDAARGDVLALLSDEAKALVLGEMMDLRAAVVRVDGTESARLRLLDSAIRRVTRGLWRYEMRRVDPAAQEIDFDVSTGRGAL